MPFKSSQASTNMSMNNYNLYKRVVQSLFTASLPLGMNVIRVMYSHAPGV